jgi:hypothetical protein
MRHTPSSTFGADLPAFAALRRLWRLLAVVALLGAGLVLIQATQAKADGSLLFAGWEPLAGSAQGAPAATTWGPGRLDVFVRGSGNDLMHKWYTGSWSGWEDLGAPPGGLGSDPGAVAWSSGRIDVFAAGMDGHLWHKWYAGGWSGWENLGGIVKGAPAVASWSAGRLDVFVRGSDDQLWHIWYAGAWSAWEARGGILTSSPAAASWGPGRIDVFVRGTDGAAWHTAYAGGWSGFDYLGGALVGAPGVSSWGAGRLDLFARGTDNRLYHQWYAGQWSGWQLAIGGVLTSSPAAVSWGPERDDVFAQGTGGGIYHAWATLPALQCPTSALSTSLQDEQGAAGSIYWFLTFVNTSATPCTLAGYPGVSYVDGTGHQIGSPATRTPGLFDFGPVPLLPGGSAQALLRLVQVGFFDPAVCHPAAAAGLRVFPPNQTTATFVPDPQMVCGNTAFTGWSSVTVVFSPTVAH